MNLLETMQSAAQNGVTWIDGHDDPRGPVNAEKVLTDYISLQERFETVRHLPEYHPELEAWFEESSRNERYTILAYLYLYVHPAQLPEWIEDLIVDHDYDVADLDKMRGEIKKYAIQERKG